VAVGATDPATTFYQRTWLTDSTGEVAFGVDFDPVQPGDTGETHANAGYVVPQVHDNYYFGYSELYYYNDVPAKVTLDYEYAIFYSD
jgi:hypothetical protein